MKIFTNNQIFLIDVISYKPQTYQFIQLKNIELNMNLLESFLLYKSSME